MSLRNAQAVPPPPTAPTLGPAVATDMARLTRRLNVCITGTLSNFFAEGPSAATWKPLDGKQIGMFGHNAEISDLTSSTNALRNTYICSCKVIEHRSTFPVPLGVRMNCIPHNEIIETGEGSPAALPPCARLTNRRRAVRLHLPAHVEQHVPVRPV